ncbi:MAG: cation diffusion facilitator family transporter [Bacteroidia bacterium]
MTASKPIWLSSPEGLLRWSFLGAIAVLLLKGASYFIGGGAGLLSDAGESVVNLLTSLLGLYGIWWAQRPRDPEHPYGHGKVDALIAAFQALIVVATAGTLAFSVITGRYLQARPHTLWEVLLYQGGAIGLNGLLAFKLWKGGRIYASSILRAESLHLMGDIATSLVVVLNFTGLFLGLPEIIDRIVGLLIVGLIGYGAIRVLRETSAALVDYQDPRLLWRLAQAVQKHRRPEWIDVHNVRIQRYGKALHIDGHVTLPWYWSLQAAHESMKHLETLLRQELGTEVEFFWHMDPCEPICCRFCEIQECTHRQANFEHRLPITPESLFVDQKVWSPSSSRPPMKPDVSQSD